MKALVTGASAGIGREIAIGLAKRGYDMILVARRTELLEELAEILPTNAEVISCDLSREDECRTLYEKTKDAGIDMLVNNAGFGLIGAFSKTDLDTELSMIDLNIRAVHILTKLFFERLYRAGFGPYPQRLVIRRVFARAADGDILRVEGVCAVAERGDMERTQKGGQSCADQRTVPRPGADRFQYNCQSRTYQRQGAVKRLCRRVCDSKNADRAACDRAGVGDENRARRPAHDAKAAPSGFLLSADAAQRSGNIIRVRGARRYTYCKNTHTMVH